MQLNKPLFLIACLTSATGAPVAAQSVATTVTVDASAGRHAIDPRIYGVAYATAAQLADLNAPLNRAGGNNSSRYNWILNADNKDFDYFFQSIGDASAVAGERTDTIFADSKVAGAQAMLTIPMVGWVAKLGPGRAKLTSFSIAKYGAQCSNDFMYFPDSGDGTKAPCDPNAPVYVTGNDPNDANVPADSTFQKAWVQHLVSKWGNAASGGVKYYILDNEHSIWFSTHRDVHPVGPHATEIRDKMIDYATMIRSVDSGAVIVGPEEYGWTGYIFSGYDQQWSAINGYNNIPDRTLVMGGMDYMPWLLQQLKASAVATGVRPIDVFSLHYYPQQNEFSNDVDNATQLLRNRSTRSLWDPAYRDTSWIDDFVQLIPRMRNWANTYYFGGTPIAITEYNWGAENHINGATTQADLYGIFGREELDIGARWTTPDATTPTYKAMKMYRNYDGAKSTFGDTSVSTAVVNPDNLSAFSALRTADGALTTMVVNKVLSGTTTLTLALNNFAGSGTARVYQLTSANAITRLADLAYAGNSLVTTLPAQSVTLFVLAPAPAGLAVTGAYSRKMHAARGPFDLPLSTTAAVLTVEPRITGTLQTIVFKLNAPVTSIGAVTVLDAAMNPVGSPAASYFNDEVRVALSGITDGQRLTVSVANINNAGVTAATAVGFFYGDVGNTGKVTASDIAATRAHLNRAAGLTTFMFDLNLSGDIDAADLSMVKARSGRTLP